MSTTHTPEWNVARIVIAHDCNNGQIPAVNELISQLEAFHRDTTAELARLREEKAELVTALKDLAAQIPLGKMHVRKDFSLLVAHAQASKLLARITSV